MKHRGQVPKWPKGADCKSAGLCLPRFESLPAHQTALAWAGELQYGVSRIKAAGVLVQLARPGANHMVLGDGIKPASLFYSFTRAGELMTGRAG